MLGDDSSLAGALPVLTNENEFGFVWKKQAKFFKAAMKQLVTKVGICDECARLVWFRL